MATILDGDLPESKSSVKISLNSKGELQFEVKVYEGTTTSQMIDIRDAAIHEIEQLATYFSDSTANKSGLVAAGKAAKP